MSKFTDDFTKEQLAALAASIKATAAQLGFSQIGIADVDLSQAEPGLLAWIAAGKHGEMQYFEQHGARRARPAELVPGTLRVISVRMDYLPDVQDEWQAAEHSRLNEPRAAVVSVYARGRDYHKLIRARLQTLATKVQHQIGVFGYRAFTDSAPVMEVELARKAGIGWRGKHTLLLNRSGGSMFFLGELFVDIALPIDAPTSDHCGSCQSCIDVCPTKAITAPYELDARRCISYLTIEHSGSIAPELRPLMGNRIYGCDDCQLVCPWNKYAQSTAEADFAVRNGLDNASLLRLWAWSEPEFDRRLQGSPIRRIGHERWLRNISIALGNAWRATRDPVIQTALAQQVAHPSALVREHVAWALAQ